MSFDLEKLYQLLPAIDRIHDSEQGKPLEALLSVIAEQVAVLEEDLAQSYDDQFIETCAGWVAPYIGDLIGYRGLHGVVPKVGSPRAEVANTIGYRRRKGTAVMLEQLAHDVTGWHAHVVEFFQLLATTQYMNHLRLTNRCAPDLRKWEPLERVNTPFDSLAHTLDVRRIPPRRGRFNIPNIGIFLWRLESFPLTNAQPARLDDRRYFFSPLGNDTPLFTLPQTLEEFSGLAARMNVPDPISRRTLDQYFGDYYGAGKSIFLARGSEPIGAEEIVVCDLSDNADGSWAHQPAEKVAIDPALGRIAFPSNDAPPDDPRVTFHYGFSAEIGGGEYDRTASIPADSIFRAPDVWQIGVSNSIAPKAGEVVATFGEAVDLWNTQAAGTTGVIALLDSGSYSVSDASKPLRLRAGSRLLIFGAHWPEAPDENGTPRRVPGRFNASGCRPHIRGNLAVAGDAASELWLNGLLVEGVLDVTGDTLAQVSLRHCSLVPGRGLTSDNLPEFQSKPSVLIQANAHNLEIAQSIVGGVRVARSVKTTATDSVIDATSRCGVAFAGLDGFAAGGVLHIENSTVIGKVHTALMEMASNTIFHAQLAAHDAWSAPVLCEQRQAGCVRFSYVPLDSITPRRYRCQPTNEDDASRVAPQFSSLRFGAPDYAQLSTRCPKEIFSGADDESEMGAFHLLYEPQRISNLEIRLAEYLRFGLEAGIFFEPKIAQPPARLTSYGSGGFRDLCEQPDALPGIGADLI